MSSLYRIVRKSQFSYPDYKGVTLVCDDGKKINNVWLELGISNSSFVPYLKKMYECCDSIPSKRIQNYFFKTAESYKNDKYKSYKLIKVKQNIGQYYPRIYRPMLKGGNFGSNTILFNPHLLHLTEERGAYDYIPGYNSLPIKSIQQLSTLIERLKSIFNNIYPTSVNNKAYGHEVRNLLILACSEVDAQLKGIMIANDIKAKGKYYTMLDYGKLKKVLKLDQYSIRFPHFPEIKSVSPFKKWNTKPGKKGLTWYNDYNAVKHNREEDFRKATLINCINSVSAVAILIISQYGNRVPHWKELIGNFFELTGSPRWKFDECYIPPIENINWTAEKIKL